MDEAPLKTHLFNTAYRPNYSLPVPPALLKLRHYGTLQMYYYCYCYYFFIFGRFVVIIIIIIIISLPLLLPLMLSSLL